MEKKGLLTDAIRARLTNAEYNGLDKATVERLYIQEYGKLPPNFEIIDSSSLGIGGKSGFNGSVVHFHDESINEVYFFNRGTEGDMDKFDEVKDDWYHTLNDYKENPENLKEIVFDGNEDIYTDIYTVLLGEDQAPTNDNIEFTKEVVNRIDNIDSNTEPIYFLDGHSMGGSEAQNVTLIKKELFADVNVYNDAPMNIYNLILSEDHLKKKIQKIYGVSIEDINDLKSIPTEELRSILDKEFSQYSDKITYYRNEGDLMTNLTLPSQYRLITESNVVTFESDRRNMEMVDLVKEYPELSYFVMDVFQRANKENGLGWLETANLAGLFLGAKYVPGFFQSNRERNLSNLLDDMEAMNGKAGYIGKGHSMDMVVSNLAKMENRTIIGNEEIIFVADSNGGRIHLNIDTTYQFYVYGQTITEGKKNALNMLRNTGDTHVNQGYEWHISKVEQKMNDIESSPHAYLSSFDNYTYDTENYILYKNLRFIEYLPAMPANISINLDDMITDIQQETERQENFLEEYKEGIKKLAEADKRVALLFDTYQERRAAW